MIPVQIRNHAAGVMDDVREEMITEWGKRLVIESLPHPMYWV